MAVILESDRRTALLKSRIEALLAGTDTYLVEVDIHGHGGGGGTEVVEVFVDTDAGILLDECHAVSHRLSEWLDTETESEQFFSGAFRLEVSSPGVSRPLRLFRQYPKNIGRTLKVKYKSADGAYETVEGKLIAVTPEPDFFITLARPVSGKKSVKNQAVKTEATANPIVIAFADIIEAKVQLAW